MGQLTTGDKKAVELIGSFISTQIDAKAIGKELDAAIFQLMMYKLEDPMYTGGSDTGCDLFNLRELSKILSGDITEVPNSWR